ncbi:hypothetical protein N0V90_012698 [Kalmusia sp. IMI 367209]|nr:hypothetical protein N0V90_012698 [Kalmusia sp. IMI 367209]
MKTAFAILSLAVLAIANPMDRRTGGGSVPEKPQDASDKCGDQVVSCCNSSDKESSSGLISAIIGPIASNGCLGVGVNASKCPVLAVQV